MIFTLVPVLLQQLFSPLIPAETRQLHSSVHASRPIVNIPQGTFTGTTAIPSGARICIEAFLGIPYALPPKGAQRYSPPGDVGTSSATFDAATYRHICIQAPILGPPTSAEDEDCLYLNVFRPSGTSQGKKLPVVVYIHGGLFAIGSGASRDIGSMVAAPKAAQIIGVSINYRLGALGFLSAGVIARAGALNLGLLDQRHALKWIQANIAAFGGDPTKVTIMGDSAGGHSVGHHLQSPLSAGLFHQAIMESGAPTARSCQPYDALLNLQQFQAFMKATGINPSQSDEDVMSALRALPASTITQVSNTVIGAYLDSERWAFQPVIDGPNGVIPSAPIDLWNSGNWNKVPILTGFCNDEGAPFVLNIVTSHQFTDFFTTLNPAWGRDGIDRINSLYPDPLSNRNSPYPTEYSRISAAYGQYAYIAPVRHSVHFASASGVPVFFYHAKVEISVVQGTGHNCIGGYVAYDSGIVNISASQKRLAMSVNAFWASFIATGDPNTYANGVAIWPQYEHGSNSANKMVLGTGNDERAGGKNVGVLVRSEVETEFLVESQFWWGKERLSEINT